MASFNKVILMGNLTRDPQVKYIPSGSAVTELGLAVNRTWFDKQSNQKKEAVDFIDVTLWGRTAEIAGEYLTKGRPVLIEGRLQYDTWEDKQTQKKMSRIRVIGETMQLLGGRPEGGGGRAPAQQRSAAPSQDYGTPPSGFDDSSFDAGGGDGPGGDEVPF
jgi:single-strand DNA-binding protein